MKIGICFTGHRPDKLGGYDWKTSKNKAIMAKLEEVIMEEIAPYDEVDFVVGGALGIDQMAFEICYNIKQKRSGIHIELAMPLEGQDRTWFYESKRLLASQRARADKVTLVDTLPAYALSGISPGVYHAAKMDKRNQYMVNITQLAIAVWDGSRGGTGNCVQYVRSRGKPLIIINPNTLIVTPERR